MRRLLIACLFLAGCFAQRGSIKAPGVFVQGVPDAGKPASLNSDTATEALPIPAGSTITVTKTEAQPATQETAAAPAVEVTQIALAAPTEWKRNSVAIKADTGTVDSSVAKHKIDAEQNKIWLYASLGSAALAIFFLYIKYPTPAAYAGLAAAVFFAAWKLSDLPDWFWAVGVSCVVGGVVMWRAHERGEKSALETKGVLTESKPATPPA